MRDIKFRAWHRTKRIMVSPFLVLEPPHKPDVIIDVAPNKEITIFDLEKRDDFKIMQYTGLKDKNGKEIYEGDIVKYYEDIDATSEISKQLLGADRVIIGLSNGVGQIVWDNEGCSFDIDGGDKFYRGFNARGQDISVEVIGNIWENEDLLTK